MHLQLAPADSHGPISLFLLTADRVSDDYVSWLNDPVVGQYLESRFATHTIESTRKYVEGVLAAPNYLFLGIHSNLLNRHVGNIKLGPVDLHHKTGEIGILIGDKAAWGKGIATAAISMISEIAHRQLALRKVTAGCYASNVGSQRAFEKAGFVVEAVRQRQCLLNGQPEDVVLMGRFFE